MRSFAVAATAVLTLAWAAPVAAQDGTTLTGTAEMAAMGRPGGGGTGAGGGTRTVDISDGMVAGNEVMFSLVLGGGQRTFELIFAGQVDGDSMEGLVSPSMGGDTAFTGTRKEG